jgi:hypothetical protein
MSDISPDDPDPGGLLGSVPTRLARPSRRPPIDDDEDGPEPPPPPNGPVSPSVPDIAVQLRHPSGQPDCLDEIDGFEDIEALLARGVLEALGDVSTSSGLQCVRSYPDAEALVACVPHGDRSATTVAVWTVPATSDRDREARLLGLQRIDLLEETESLGIFVNASFIRRIVADEFECQPKRYSGSGRPDRDGPIHITGHTVEFTAPDRVTLQIRGYDERPWPDVSFTISVVDTLNAESGGGLPKVVCDTVVSEPNIDASWVNAATFVATGVLVHFSPLYLAVQNIRDILAAHPFGDHSAPEVGGAGCAVALTFFQSEFAIPGGQKLVIFYTRTPVTSGGMFATGGYLLAARDPHVTILGPRQLAVNVSGPGVVSAMYRVTGSDLRGDVSIQWTPNGGRSTTPTLAATNVAWMRPTGADVGDIVMRRLNVRVEDEDGLVAGANIEVEIHVVEPSTEPSICDQKPWLPQCQDV